MHVLEDSMQFSNLDSALARSIAALALSVPLLGGCETNPPVPTSSAAALPATESAAVIPPTANATTTSAAVPSPAKSKLEFIDLQGFDRDLHNALSATLPAIDVAFYSRVSPSALPERLQKWMAAVESGGGTIKVTPPKSTVTAKNPFLIIGVVNFAFNVSKAAKLEAEYSQFKPAKSFDAEIVLKADGEGESIVDKVVFTPRVK
jgi:hypothetical protein